MPFELGMFLGATRFGNRAQRMKSSLILDREPHRYQQFISDIAGHDVHAHANDPERAIHCVRDWLAPYLPREADGRHGAHRMIMDYRTFQLTLPELCARLKRKPEELAFTDYSEIVWDWIYDVPAETAT